MIVVAVASGTSADGIDVGVVDFTDGSDSEALEAAVIETRTEAWPGDLRQRLLALLPPAASTAAEWCALDTEVGRALAGAARSAQERLAAQGRTADLIVSPGQTVHHEVSGDRCLGTLQIGQPAWIAEATGLPVVSDLRARDVAAGGHGAPLAGVLDGLWLAGGRHAAPRVALNLGGIANVSIVTGAEVAAWDTGPANCLLDVAAGWATDGAESFDRGGRWAARGEVDTPLLHLVRAHPFFALDPPKSTGRETFTAAWLQQTLAERRRDGPVGWPDVLATLVELTASTVADAVRSHAPSEVVVSGGGAANPVLMAALRRSLSGVEVLTSDRYGLPAEGKEAVLWALLGWLTWHGVPVSTGPHPARILGRFTPGSTPLRVPDPRPAPHRLHLR